MKDTKPTYEQLESRLAEAEKVIEAIESGQADAIVSKNHVMMLRLKEAEENLRIHQAELEAHNSELREAQEKLAESRDRYTELFDFAPIGYFVLDKKGRITQANLTGVSMVGIQREFLITRPFALCVSEENRDGFYLNRRQVFRTGISSRCDLKMLRKDGGEFFAALIIEPVTDAGRNVIHCRIAVIDITQRKEAKQKLSEAHALLDTLLKQAPIGFAYFDRDLRYVMVNERLADMNGMPVAEHIGKRIQDILPSLAPGAQKIVDQILTTGEPVKDRELGGETASAPGVKRYWNESWYPLRDDTGRIIGFGAVVHEITEQKQAEQALRKARDELELRVKERTAALAQTVAELREEVQQRISAEQSLKQRTRDLDAFFANTIEPLAILDKDFNFIRVNRAYADAGRRDISEFAGHNHFELYPNEENQRIFEEAVRTRTPYQARAKQFSYPGQPQRGITYWDWTLVPVLDENGEVQMVLLSLKDVTSQKRAELGLRESEEKYRSLVEVSPEAISVVIDEKIAFVNAEALEFIGASNDKEVLGRPMWDFLHRDSVEQVRRDVRKLLAEKRRVPPREAKLVRLDGTTVEIEASAASVIHQGQPAILVIYHDITERKRAHEQIIEHRSRLRLLASQLQVAEEQERRRIAHDLHDSIGQMLAFSGRELRSLKKIVPPQAAKELQDVIHQLNAAVKQTRTLSFNLSPSTLYDLGFEDAVEELTERFGQERKIACGFEQSDEPKPLSDSMKILLYRSIRELLMNVAKHAKAKSARVCLARDNNDIRIVVEDNGKGFDPAILDDRTARRKGFGLFSIRERLISVGGRFEVESAKGKGAKFTLSAPLQTEANQDRG